MPTTPTTPTKKKVLVLGGTGYIGPHIVRALVAAGHTVTLFNRGKTHTELFPDLEKLHGDRDGHLEALQGRKWDAVIDDAGFVPRIVEQSAKLLAPSVKQYVFISTISVYKDIAKPGMDETAAVDELPADAKEEDKRYYGPFKAACEKTVEAALPGRATILRPGVIVGPGDPTGRFTHWASRIADGGDVLAPGDGTTPVQYIDVRDLAAFVARVVADTTVGTYNVLAPEHITPIKDFLAQINAATGNHAQIIYVPADFLEKQDVHGWSDMPLWLPPTGDFAGIGTQSNARAVAKGLTFRPLAETTKDTLAWLQTVPEADRPKLASTGISRDREAKVIAAWRSHG
ncbi:MAG: NAD-dependent epimerase/dehydratase family protein [Deltaproteobacteria bacterium]|nr:NAD-dependent epimerase/dehydratase family protein [Deltaproteobacteria bacterium]